MARGSTLRHLPLERRVHRRADGRSGSFSSFSFPFSSFLLFFLSCLVLFFRLQRSIDSRSSLLHHGLVIAHMFMQAGTPASISLLSFVKLRGTVFLHRNGQWCCVCIHGKSAKCTRRERQLVRFLSRTLLCRTP